jgi:hypothetical protein
MQMFVSIASYRDPELGSTIDDCLAKASCPERLRFGVCWQHGADEAPPAAFADKRVEVLDVDWRESRGTCWARAEVMKLWRGEDWYLQLDSHHRFVPGWDELLIDQAARSGSSRPVLTTYVPPYDPSEPDPVSGIPTQMDFDRFTEDGIPLFKPGYIGDWKERDRPLRGRFISAHMLFAPGSFVGDIPYDPELYFTGEEITLAVRAFTHGYDLFTPSRLVTWHEYTRNFRRKHWGDHESANGDKSDLPWYERDASSRAKVQRFLADPWLGKFGLGTARSFADYESYAGISFHHRQVQDYTREHREPPNPAAEPDWAERTGQRRVHILLDRDSLPTGALKEPAFWYVGLHRRDGTELYRQDAAGEELEALLDGDSGIIKISRSFESESEPARWTVIPFGTREGWLQGISGPTVHGYVGIAPAADHVSNETPEPVVFSPEMYVAGRAGTRRSAAILAPFLYDLTGPRTVIDVGCGEGWFAREFARLGCRVIAVDQTAEDAEVDDVSFRHIELPSSLDGFYDLALCLEVAEHLPRAAAGALIDVLTAAAPVVAFSAAVPGQGGHGHVNEQWPGYWAAKFRQRGYVVSGALRYGIWHDDRIEPWYRQNLLIAVESSVLRSDRHARLVRAAFGGGTETSYDYDPLPLVVGNGRSTRWCPSVRPGLKWDEVDGWFQVRTVDMPTTAKHVVNPLGMFLMELSDGHSSLDEITGIAQQLWGSLTVQEVFEFFESATRAGLVETCNGATGER